MTEEDLTQNPQFCKLLATLAQHVDPTGLTVPLKAELDKVPAATVLTVLAQTHTLWICYSYLIHCKYNQKPFVLVSGTKNNQQKWKHG